MTPDQLAKSGTEHAIQRAFFAWLALAANFGFAPAKDICEGRLCAKDARGATPNYPELQLFHAIPNGGARDKITAGKLKAEGVKSGVLDTFLPVSKPYTVAELGKPRHTYSYAGLYIEFKKADRKNTRDGGLSPEQQAFGDGVAAQGYCWRVAYSWREAANVVMLYYGVDTRFDTT